MAAATHVPVMRDAVLHYLAPRDGAIYVDGTFGGGGYSAALLEAASCTVWGIDRDPEAVARGEAMARHYPGRLNMRHGRYGEMDQLLGAEGIGAVDGVTLDIGVSSYQIDAPERGFSFREDGPLDMRMDNCQGPSAADLVNNAGEAELADIIWRYGEERHARRIARAITAARSAAPIRTTSALAAVVRKAVPAKRGAAAIDPATRTFQAIRIHVNDEIGELRRGLPAAETLLVPGGRIAVVTFHSLEDREVKRFLQSRAGRAPRASRHLPADGGLAPSFTLLTRRVVRPETEEVRANPRARSARLRAAERTDAPALGGQERSST